MPYLSFAHRPDDPECPCNDCGFARGEDRETIIYCPECGDPITEDPDVEEGELCCVCESRLIAHYPFKKR